MEPVFVNCEISAAAFSGERVFTVQQAEGGDYVGLSPLHYCFHENGNALAPSEPARDTPIQGRLAARKIGDVSLGARVTIPDGRAIIVPVNLIRARPPGAANVPV